MGGLIVLGFAAIFLFKIGPDPKNRDSKPREGCGTSG
jgi:hypothetical protein